MHRTLYIVPVGIISLPFLPACSHAAQVTCTIGYAILVLVAILSAAMARR